MAFFQQCRGPTLDASALHGLPGRIVKAVSPHTEADPAAILVQLLAGFGACIGSSPHIKASNTKHHAVIHPLVVGRTSDGAKGTALGVVMALLRNALPEFERDNLTSGLSTAEGLTEAVRDAAGAPDSEEFDEGIADKRLLITESEYKNVFTRSRREGNTLGPTLRQAWDGDTLRTLTRKRNKLTATGHHIVVIGHITPKELKATATDSDLSGGSINRLLICLSRRSKRHPRLGNIPPTWLTISETSSAPPGHTRS